MIYREEYLKKIKKEKNKVIYFQISIVILFLLVWQILSGFNIIDPFIFSSPLRIIHSFIEQIQKDLLYHISITVLETVIGFSLGVIIGFFIAVAMWFSPFLTKVLSPFLVVLNSLPKIALGPVIIVFAGADMKSIILMAIAISLIVTVLELSGGFNKTDKNLITALESFGANKKSVFLKLVLPYNLSVLFQSFKINIGLSLVGVIAGEFLTSKAGLGYMIVYAGQVFRMDIVMMNVFILGVIAYLMYAIINLIEKIVLRRINQN